MIAATCLSCRRCGNFTFYYHLLISTIVQPIGGTLAVHQAAWHRRFFLDLAQLNGEIDERSPRSRESRHATEKDYQGHPYWRLRLRLPDAHIVSRRNSLFLLSGCGRNSLFFSLGHATLKSSQSKPAARQTADPKLREKPYIR
jgi:hypothetical protein